MQNPNQPDDQQKQKKLPVDWNGLGNEPRNENLAKIKLGSFERMENARGKDFEPEETLHPLNKKKKHARRR